MRARLLITIGVLAIASGAVFSPASAHEGHAPLPTKGVEVNVEKGLLTLSPHAHKSLGVAATELSMQPMQESALAYATLVTPWTQQHFVGSQLAGRIAALHVATGETVRPGQVLAEVSSPELEALRLELRNAANALSLSSREAQRLQKLAGSGAVAARQSVEATAKEEQDQIALHAARIKLESLSVSAEAIDRAIGSATDSATASDPEGNSSSLLLVPLTSPIGGVVGHTDLAIGKVVAAGEHLFEINDLSSLWVRIGVLEADLSRTAVGQPVRLTFTAFPNEVAEATIAIAPVEVDPETHVAVAWAEIDNSENSAKYLPGMVGTARIDVSKPKKLLTAPAASLLGKGAERYVLVEVAATAKGYEYRKQPVVVAAANAEVVQFEPGGAFPGDRVVAVGAEVLSSFFILGSLRLSDEGVRNVGLKVAPVAKRAIEEVVAIDGMVDLATGQVALVSSPAPGAIERLYVDRAAKVAAGQLLAEVGGLEFQETQLTLLQAEAEARLLENTLERLQSVGGNAAIAARRLWETENSLADAINRRDSTRQTLLTLGMQPAEVDEIVISGKPRKTLSIRSPIDGYVVGFDKVLGETILPEETLFEIHDLSRPLVKAFLSEREAARVSVGAEVRVRLFSDPETIFPGRVARSSRVFGESDRTLAAWIEFDPSIDRLLPRNLLASVSAVVGKPQQRLAVPVDAIVRDRSRSYVFVQKKKGLLERRRVETGLADDRFVQIVAGLTAGERIAVQGAEELQTTYASVR